MYDYSEQYRLHNFQNSEQPPKLHSTLVFECANKENCITKIIEVMELITSHTRNNWPDDDFWREGLPQWLLKTFKSYTPAELSEILSDSSSWDELPWTFGSWLDRMRDRDWKWWSIDTKKGNVTIYLVIDGYPFSAKALEHLIIAAGGKFLNK